MVAIPVGYDQPGVAARIAYHGVGEFIEIGNLTTRRLSQLIAKIRENPKYRDKAGWFRKVLEETDGLEVAADIVERAFEDRFEDKPAVNRTRMLGMCCNFVVVPKVEVDDRTFSTTTSCSQPSPRSYS